MEEVGNVLLAVFKQRARLGGASLADVLSPLWARVTGKAMAQHSSPVAFEAGTLTVATDCPAWATELGRMAEEIRAAVNRFLREPAVRHLRVEQRESFKAFVPQPGVPAASPALETIQRQSITSTARLDPDLERIVASSFAKYFARQARRTD